MNRELRYPRWQKPLHDAISRVRSPNFIESLKEVETVLLKRLHLLTGSGRLGEQQALAEALSTIRILKQR
jgi:hypothetical protein